MAESGRGGRLVRVGCAVLVVLGLACTGCGGGVWSVVLWFVRATDVYQEAVTIAKDDPDVQLALGLPIDEGWLTVGHVSRSPAGGEAWFRIPLEGTKEDGVLRVEATLSGSTWQYSVLEVEADGAVLNLHATIVEQEEKAATEQSFDTLAEADALAGQGRHADAIVLYDRAVEKDPANAEAWFRRGKAWYEMDHLAEAEADFSQAAQLAPRHVGALAKLGAVYQRTGRYEACIDTFTRVLKIDEDDGDAWYQRAVCYDRAGQPRQASAGAREACARGSLEGCEMAR